MPDDLTLAAVCPSTVRGVSNCFGAASFHSSTTQPTANGQWNYTLRADGSLGTKIFVDGGSNDAQIFVLPLQHAIDTAIASVDGGTPLPENVQQYPFTNQNQEERAANIVRLYQGSVISILAVAFFIAMVGVTYQLVGHMALEREQGMSQLIEVMMPNKRRWQPQVARLLAAHLAFDILYLPGWIINGIIVSRLVFPVTSIAMIIILHVLGGLALSSFSLLFASFFKRAQLSGITTTIVSLVMAIIAQIALGRHASSGAVIILSLLFTPMNYTFFLIYTAGFQQKSHATNLTQYSPGTDWQVRGITFWVFLIIQIFVFPVLGALVERSLYGTASKTRKMKNQELDSAVAVNLDGFSKSYGTSWFKRMLLCCGRRKYKSVIKAVDDLSLKIRQGQIMVLLGANGSGKSTTLDAIAGLNTITKGSIEIDGRGGLGLCPQKNVLWDELTVYEHVRVFNRLKSTEGKASRRETEELVAACDLAVKLKAKAGTLSGGQKRKLQLAMMFTGGSRVCCVDEVSSGIDPLARRKVWDILLNERGRRTILLTTHFLDEADVLSDHIAILSKGVLKAEGTAVELKHNLGGGYRVSVGHHTGYRPDSSLGNLAHNVDYDRTIYHLANSSEVSRLISDLDRAGIDDFSVQGPTVEDVFLKLADEVKYDFGVAAIPHDEEVSLADKADGERSSADSPSDETVKGGALNLLPGRGTGLFRQTWILFTKRFNVLKRNYLPYVAAVLIPIIAAGLVTLFLKNFEALSCSASQSRISSEELNSLAKSITVDVVFGPPDAIPTQLIGSLYPGLNSSSLHPVNSLADMQSYVAANYHNVTPGGFWVGDNPTFAWLAQYNVYEPVLVQNLIDSLLIGTIIRTGFQSFSTPFAPGAGATIQLVLYFGLAMSAYPGLFALYPTAERLRKVRALHYSNGIRGLPLWAAYIWFDFIFVLIISTIGIALFVGQWHGWYYPGYLFVVFFLYGLTSAVYSYVISLFTTSQLATFAFASGSQAVMFLIYFIAYLAIITYAPVNQIDHYVSIAHFTIATVTPSGNLARALLLTLNEFSLLCRGLSSIASYPGAIDVYGGPILYLLIQFFALSAFLVWYDSGGRLSLRRKHKQRSSDLEEETTTTDDPTIREELSRVQSSNDGLRALHLHKNFGTVTAVENITFGVRKSEVFCLLGPNGAGKSTTISLIRGDLRPSNNNGDVIVEGIPLSSHRAAARHHLGVCPQFDAIDALTTAEHLRFYASVRGVPDVNHNVTTVMAAVGLTTYANRLASKLSGGNKRKLSLAIALMGNPSVLLLDEPSSGMDAAAKRVMWRVLSSVVAGRALLITTHSMEEADALADRAGIMARRMLALGTSRQLRERHGDAWYVHLVHEGAPHTSSEEMERVREWVVRNVAGASVEERTYHGQLRFTVPNRASTSSHAKSDADESNSTTLPALFTLLESSKEQLRFAHYSVSPATLDQVFLNVVRKHNVEEENYAAEHAGGEKEKRAGVLGRLGLRRRR